MSVASVVPPADHADLSRTFWASSAPPGPATTPLAGDAEVETVIVGAGFSGLSTALHLVEGGQKPLLLEAGVVGCGASGRNNGQVIPTLTRPDPSDMMAAFGPARGRRLAMLVRDAASVTFDIIRRHAIDCAAEQTGWIQPAHSASRVRLSEKRVREWRDLGAPVELLDRKAVSDLLGTDRYFGGWLNPTGGHVNPLALARGLAKAVIGGGGVICERSPARTIQRLGDGRWAVTTPGGKAIARRVVLATNAYSDDLWPGLRREIVPVLSFQMATRPLTDNVRKVLLPGRQAMSDTRGDLHFCRYTADHRLVSGGNLIWPFGVENRLREHVGRRLQGLFPQLGLQTFDYLWSGYIGMTSDRLPRLHELAPGLIAWIGCNGRGVAFATAMGAELARWAAGDARADDLALPETPLAPLPAHALARFVVPAMLWVYRRRDERDG